MLEFTSEKFNSLPDELLAKYIDGVASDEEVMTIMDAIICGADLWTFRNMVASVEDDS